MTISSNARTRARTESPAGTSDTRPSSVTQARTARYDAQVEAGTGAAAGSPLAAHYLRLSSRRERGDMVQALMMVMQDAGLAHGDAVSTPRAPIRGDVVRESADVVQDALSRLAGPLPVRTRGVARLRMLLGDGRGPLYRCGSGSFAAAMRGVLAAL